MITFTFNINELCTLNDGEIIKKLKNTNNYYITNHGRLYSTHNNIFLKGNIGKDGYTYMIIRINNKNVTVKPYRLVAEYFIKNPNNYTDVNHKDENKQNNNVNNLEWCTKKYNNSYGTRLTRVSESRGIKIDVYKNEKYFCTENSINVCVKKYHVGINNILDQLKGIKKKWYKNNSEFSFAYKGYKPIKDNFDDIATYSFKNIKKL